MEVNYILSGLIVGFLTGLTGVGGGSLMTPVLILFLGFAPIKAVGTDLLFNAITKIVGVAVLHKRNHVDWKRVGLLLMGSLPAVILSIICIKLLDANNHDVNDLLKKAVGCIIIVSMLLFLLMTEGRLILKRFISLDYFHFKVSERSHMVLTVLAGSIVGFIVAFTSIGSGILGTLVLILLYPKWMATRILATEMAHAIPITLVAGLGYMSLGHINLNLLTGLLIGSIPAMYVGSRLASAMPHRLLKLLMVVFLIFAALQLLLHK